MARQHLLGLFARVRAAAARFGRKQHKLPEQEQEQEQETLQLDTATAPTLPPEKASLHPVIRITTPRPAAVVAAPPNPIVAVSALPHIAFVPAAWYRTGRRRERAFWVVLHCTAGAEGKRKAEDCAHMLANIPPRAQGGKPRSAHLVIDTDSCVQCVPFECEAWHCGGHGNRLGEGIELRGSDKQTRAQWLDAQSLPMLAIAAHVVRWRCDELQIPVEFCDAAALRAERPGVTTHAEVSRAFPQDTSHYDPGPHFPLQELLAAARDIGA